MSTITINANGGNWNTSGTWVGGIVPTAGDDVQYDALTGTLTIDGTESSPNLCRSFTATSCSGTLNHASEKYLKIGDNASGNFILVSGLNYIPSSSSFLVFASTTTGNQITTTGKRMGSIKFDGSGGAWQFQDSCDNTSGSTINIIESAGSNGVDFNSKNIGATSGVLFYATGSNTRSIIFGSMTWKLPASSSIDNILWNISNSTNLTMSASGLDITCSMWSAVNYFYGGGQTYNSLSVSGQTIGSFTLYGINTFGTLSLSCGANVGNVSTGYFFGANQTITGTWNANGNNVINRIFIASDTTGTPRTITTGSVNFSYMDIQDITGNTWDLSSISGGAGDGGGNSGITFSTPKNCYMKTTSSVNWGSANWYTTSGGSTQISPLIPLIHDTAKFDTNSFSSSLISITRNIPRISAMDWTGVTNAPTWNTGGSVSWKCYGSIILDSSMYSPGTGYIFLLGRGSHTLDSGTISLSTAGIYLVAHSGTYTLANNLQISGYLQTNVGALAGANYTLSCSNLIFNGGTCSGFGTISSGACTVAGGSFTLGDTCTLTGDIIISSGTLDMNNNNITGNTTTTISGIGLLNLSGQINGSGAITLSRTSGIGIADTGNGELKGATLSKTNNASYTIDKITLSSSCNFTGAGNITIGSGGIDCSTFTIDTGFTANFITSGLIECSSDATLAGNAADISLGSGGIDCSSLTFDYTGSMPTWKLGSGNITLRNSGIVFNPNYDLTTPGKLDVGTSNFIILGTNSTFIGLGNTYNNIKNNCTFGNVTITGSNTFNTLTCEPDTITKFEASSTTDITNIDADGTLSDIIVICTTEIDTFATLNLTNHANISNISIQDIHVTSTDGHANVVNPNFINVSGNTGWTWTNTDVGSYSITGKDVDFGKTYLISSSVGNYTYSAQDVILSYGKILNSENGTYNYTGQNIDFLRTYILNSENGTYNYTGQDVNLLQGYLISLDIGTYTYTGQDVDFFVGKGIIATVGTYTYSGQSTDLLKTHLLKIDTATYSITGQNITMWPGYLISLDIGTYNYTGQNIDFLRTYILNSENGTYNYTGQDVDLLQDYFLSCTIGNYYITKQDIILLRTHLFSIDTATYSYIGKNVNLEKGYILNSSFATYSYIGKNVNLLNKQILKCRRGRYYITGQNINLEKGGHARTDYLIYCKREKLYLVGKNVDFGLTDRVIKNSPGTFDYTGKIINLFRSRIFTDIESGVYNYTGQNINYLLGYCIKSEVSEYNIIGSNINKIQTYILYSDMGTFDYTGKIINLLSGNVLFANNTNYFYTGNNSELFHGYCIKSEVGKFKLEIQNTIKIKDYLLLIESGTYEYTTKTIAVRALLEHTVSYLR